MPLLKAVEAVAEVVNGVRCVLGVMLCMLFRMLLCILEALEVCCVLLCILEAVDGGLCLLEAREVPEATRSVLLCTPVAVKVGIYLLEMLGVPEMMRCALLCTLEAVDGGLFAGGVGG